MRRLFVVIVPVLGILLMGCGPERLLKKAEIYIKGTPPVQILYHPPTDGTLPAHMDPMQYTEVLIQGVQDALKLEGFKVNYLPMDQSFEPSKSGQFVLEMAMAMVQERPSLTPDPADGGMMSMNVQLSAMLIVVDKEGNPNVNDYQESMDLSPQEQSELINADPEADLNRLVLDKVTAGLAIKLKEDILQHLKENKKGL